MTKKLISIITILNFIFVYELPVYPHPLKTEKLYSLRPISLRNASHTPNHTRKLIRFYMEVTRYMHNADLRMKNTMDMMVKLHEMDILMEQPEKIDATDLLLQREDLVQDIVNTLRYWQDEVIPKLTELHTQGQLNAESPKHLILIVASLYRNFCNYIISILRYDFRVFLMGNELLISLANVEENILSQDQAVELAFKEPGEISYAYVIKLAMDINERFNELMVKFGFSPGVMDIYKAIVRMNVPEEETIIPIADPEAILSQQVAVYADLIKIWQEEVFPKCHEWLKAGKGSKDDRIIICIISMYFDEMAKHIGWYTQEQLRVDLSPESSDFHTVLLGLDKLLKQAKATHAEFTKNMPYIQLMKDIFLIYSMPITHPDVFRGLPQVAPVAERKTQIIMQINSAA